MNTLKKIAAFSLVLATFIFGLSACQTSIEEAASSAVSANRAANKAMAAEYGYKALAAYKNGRGMQELSLEQLADLEGQAIGLMVLFEADAPWAANLENGAQKTGNDQLNGHMEAFGLKIAKKVEIDDFLAGLFLEGDELNAKLAVEAAKEISLVDNVMMVEVKEIPKDRPSTSETAKN